LPKAEKENSPPESCKEEGSEKTPEEGAVHPDLIGRRIVILESRRGELGR